MLLGVVSLLWSFVCIDAVKGNGEWVEDIGRANRLWYAALIFKGKATRRVVKDLLLCEPHIFQSSKISDHLFLLLLALVLQGTASKRGQGHWPASMWAATPAPSDPKFFSSQIRMLWFTFLLACCLAVPQIAFLLLVGNWALYRVLYWDRSLPLAGWGLEMLPVWSAVISLTACESYGHPLKHLLRSFQTAHQTRWPVELMHNGNLSFFL